MSKHTPGPWRFYTEPQPNGCPIVGAGGLMVCMLAHTVKQPEQRNEALANARLIAAAPELLKALILAASHMHTLTTPRAKADYSLIRAAIAKATGEKT